MRNLLVPSLLFLLLTTQSALGHEAKPVWALNSAEQAELDPKVVAYNIYDATGRLGLRWPGRPG